MNKISALLGNHGGKLIGAALSILFIIVGIVQIRSFFTDSTTESGSYSTYICTETGRTFQHKNQIGETVPILSPYSGKNTGVPAEACYWTADGGTKSDPTWVLLNEAIGKPGPTFCPDCGRLVVSRNPPPRPGATPPPTQEEYAARHANRDYESSRSDR